MWSMWSATGQRAGIDTVESAVTYTLGNNPKISRLPDTRS
jgi:hypothetical protein